MIRLIKHPFLEYQHFPYTPEIERYLEIGRPHLEILRNYQKKGDKRVTIIYQNSENEQYKERSEIYGFINRSSFNRYFNNQLRKAGQLLLPRKDITFHGYRRGLAINCTKINGIAVTRIVLAHATISSTEAYIEYSADETIMRKYMACIDSVDDSKNAIFKTFTIEEEALYVDEIEENLE